MIVLGIESSCDECSAAIVTEDKIISHVIASQIPLHRRYGGVVPEIASRAHIMDIVDVLKGVFDNEDNIRREDIQGVAVTQGPGLIGSLLVGIEAAKAFAYAYNLPLVGVHHTEGHLLAGLIESAQGFVAPEFPFMGLVVSGGHTDLILVNGVDNYTAIGSTLDDAAGECLDKIGKILSLPYPGGVHIDRISQGGDHARFPFPRPLAARDNFDFSFSGLKTAAMTALRKFGHLPEGQDLSDFCASALEAVVDSLVNKTIRACLAHNCKSVAISGGVSANRRLRQRLGEECARHGLSLSVPPVKLCTDNAAMIAGLGLLKLKKLRLTRFDAFDIQPRPGWSLI